MSIKQHNFFDQATQLVSLDCSSITGQNITMFHNVSQSLHQSILNLKIVLPTFTSEFSLFKEEIMEMTYYIVNKLMTVVKCKNLQLLKLQQDLQKSQSLTNSMKKQVIQLKQMISQFMQSYSKEIQIKQKEISQRQKQINDLKSVLHQNFNNPTNLCQLCQNQNSQHKHDSMAINVKRQTESHLRQHDYFQNYGNNEAILIQISQSIVCESKQIDKRMSLEIIQEEASDINSLTDYLHSQRFSQMPDKDLTSNSCSQIAKSTRQTQNQQIQQFYTGKASPCESKSINSQPKTIKYMSQCQRTIKDRSPLGKINIVSSPDQRLYKDNFSSSITNNNYFQNQSIRAQNERRSSHNSISQKSFYDGFKIQRRPLQSKILPTKNIQNTFYVTQNQECMSLKHQIQQMSKSSSSSDIMHFGDTDKINVNLPKKFDSPKNMSLVKKNSSRKQERLRTQPSPRNLKLDIDKENINLGFAKPVQIGRKIFARKKTIMTHAKANNTSRIQSRGNKISGKQQNLQQIDLNNRKIQIKYIQSPQKLQTKSNHLLRASDMTIFNTKHQQITPHVNNYIMYSSVALNISNVNESHVRTHHEYHSTGKYQQTSQSNKHRGSLLLNKSTSVLSPKSKPYDRKSLSKSKQKLKVTSKNTPQLQSASKVCPKSDQKQQKKLLAEMMNQSHFISQNPNNLSRNIKPKNLAVHFGLTGMNKLHLKQNLHHIKIALKDYSLEENLKELNQVFYDGKYTSGVRQGFGKIVYDNGLIYQGHFIDGRRQGEAKLVLNGIEVYQGQFIKDSIEGQGHLKFLRYMSPSSKCPKPLQNSSYFGRFVKNKFDGMGTLFLNQRQKIVTKFSNGIPYGQLTFYTQNDIQFGHWPTD